MYAEAAPEAMFQSFENVSHKLHHLLRKKKLLTQGAEATKLPLFERGASAYLLKLVVLSWRENVGGPAGILPLAFSDMPRNWSGTASSTIDETEGVRDDWDGAGRCSCS